MAKKALTVSIVIPVYNEESYIGPCLDAIAAQTVAPLEVIIVDNNCSDDTLEVVSHYSFVTVLREKKQGQVFAQAKGFNYANGAILGRIDADTIIPKNWVASVLDNFDDEHTVAVTGPGVPYDVPMHRAGSAVFNFYHNTVARIFSGHQMLWGANFAMRSSAWNRVKNGLHMQRNIWEDYDLSFHLAAIGAIVFDKAMGVTCSFRAGHQSVPKQLEYQFRHIRTFRLHRGRLKTSALFFAWYTMIVLTPFAVIDRYLWLLRSVVGRMVLTVRR